MKNFSTRCLVGGSILGVMLMWAVDKYELNYDHLVKGQHWVRWTEQVSLPSGEKMTVDRAIFLMPNEVRRAKHTLQFRWGIHQIKTEWVGLEESGVPVGLYLPQGKLPRLILEKKASLISNRECINYVVLEPSGWEWWGRDLGGLSKEDIEVFSRGLNLKIVSPETGELSLPTNLRFPLAESIKDCEKL